MTTSVRATRERWVRGGALVLAACVTVAGTAARADGRSEIQAVAQAGAERQFDISAQILSDALALFGQQAGMQVSAHGDLVRGKTSNALSGSMAPRAALSTLLAGTGLLLGRRRR